MMFKARASVEAFREERREIVRYAQEDKREGFAGQKRDVCGCVAIFL
jgi:hypothetical protein